MTQAIEGFERGAGPSTSSSIESIKNFETMVIKLVYIASSHRVLLRLKLELPLN